MENQEYNYQALRHVANMYMMLLQKFLPEGNNTVNPELMILSASRMAGTLMFESLLTESINKKSFEPISLSRQKIHALSGFVDSTVKSLGCNIDLEKAKSSFDPAILQKYPISDTQEKFVQLFKEIAKTVGISLAEAALSSSLASAYMVNSTQHILDINKAYMLALSGHNEALTFVSTRYTSKS